jgi:hypothetical protein
MPHSSDKTVAPVKAGATILPLPEGVTRGEAAALCAPPGECEYCDRRRAYAASSMRRSRAKRTGGSDG